GGRSQFFWGKKADCGREMIWLNKKTAEKASPELEQLTRYAADPNPDTVLILTQTPAPDKRRKLVQNIAKSGRVVEFPLLKEEKRDKWLADYWQKHGKTADRAAIEYTTVNCGGGLGQLKLEADKLLLYAADQPCITAEMAKDAVSPSALSGVFQLTDAAASRQAGEACRVYRQLLQGGESEQMLLAMLSNQYRHILAVQDMAQRGENSKTAAKILSIHPYVAEKCALAARRFSRRQLIKALDLLLAADIAQKTGQGNLKDGLELAILRICQF
ncbi:MAG: DNA polymerase III subunit delta, partial [Clostridiales bacterium]